MLYNRTKIKDAPEWVRHAALALISLLMGCLALTVCLMEKQDQDDQQKEYCQMVKLYKQTNGDSGWPDYNASYDELCVPDPT